ncbi:response regulator [Hymenobacter psychrotolerans]|uniref:Response regulator receiver domain-containing protein n=1 Tax=Hymenobacter psychrotolerans DSM 18569 TaxID=1121959 RepID=A0A1M7EZB1_9BACT|nr:response regulator [Hymenobacter psychrotolerans]SHL96769.1 Response regulator receiver domain-containing protein [Hymenobacter psychrotolerans DSM 18569]
MQLLPTVLLVDDDQTARYLAARLLRPYADRVRVLMAEDGHQALQLLAHYATELVPTLVLLDLQMPVLDGFGFLHAQLGWPPARRAAVRVVIVSSSDIPAEEQRARELGVPMLPKPLTAATLARVLHQQLGEAFQLA